MFYYTFVYIFVLVTHQLHQFRIKTLNLLTPLLYLRVYSLQRRKQ